MYNTSLPIAEMLFVNALFNPSMAVAMSVTVKTPITIPNVAKAERNLCARTASNAMRKPSPSSWRILMDRVLQTRLASVRIKPILCSVL